MRNLILIWCFLMMATTHTVAQKQDAAQLGFLNFLLNGEHYTDLFAHAQQLQTQGLLTDSATYIIGKGAYLNRNLHTGIEFLATIKHKPSLVQQGTLLQALLLAEAGQKQQAFDRFGNLPQSYFDQSVYNFYQRGFALLNRQLEYFEQPSGITENNYLVYANDTLLNGLAAEVKAHKKRSPFVAGALSAVVPGLGKLYAGRTGESIGTFFLVVGLLGQVYEGYVRAGHDLNNWRSITFGGIFSAYYVANIWGSVFSVKIRNYEFNESIDRQVLIQLHLPIRRLLFWGSVENRR